MNRLGEKLPYLQLRVYAGQLYFDSTRVTGSGILVRVHDGHGCARRCSLPMLTAEAATG